MIRTEKPEVKLLEMLLSMGDDPLAYANAVYPWGEPGLLAHFAAPRQWQQDVFRMIRDHFREGRAALASGQAHPPFKLAVASGHGVGKSALTAMLLQWFQDTHLGATGIVTANSEAQLKDKTWGEFSRWHNLGLSRTLFNCGATAREPIAWFDRAIRTEMRLGTDHYYAKWNLWSKDNPAAFAGTHSQQGVMLIMDEASGIPQDIWTESLGFFTDPILPRVWIAFSNPRTNTGPFADLFKPGSGWRTMHLDSRDVEGTDLAYFQGIVDKHGEDSDTARVRVRGLFPRQSEDQFIGFDEVDAATQRRLPLHADMGAPLILGVDPAGGRDATVLRWRQGVDARSIPPVEMFHRDDELTAQAIAVWIHKTRPDAVFIDKGYGHGIISRLRSLRFQGIHGINFAGTPLDDAYLNMRAYMWGQVKEWLRDGCIDGHAALLRDLSAPNMFVKDAQGKKQLEGKDSLQRRGMPSTDHADALALTFAAPVARRDQLANRHARNQVAEGIDYDVFAGR